MVILKIFVRYISAFDYYEVIYWFCANTFENKMLQYFTETSESHIGYFQLWRHILRHLRHLLALCWKSHKPPFRLAQLICICDLTLNINSFVCSESSNTPMRTWIEQTVVLQILASMRLLSILASRRIKKTDNWTLSRMIKIFAKCSLIWVILSLY